MFSCKYWIYSYCPPPLKNFLPKPLDRLYYCGTTKMLVGRNVSRGHAEVLLKMVGFRGGTPFFITKIAEKKGLRCKISGLSVQKYVKTKTKRSLLQSKWVSSPKECEDKKKERSSPKNQLVFSPNEDGDDQTK